MTKTVSPHEELMKWGRGQKSLWAITTGWNEKSRMCRSLEEGSGHEKASNGLTEEVAIC